MTLQSPWSFHCCQGKGWSVLGWPWRFYKKYLKTDNTVWKYCECEWSLLHVDHDLISELWSFILSFIPKYFQRSRIMMYWSRILSQPLVLYDGYFFQYHILFPELFSVLHLALKSGLQISFLNSIFLFFWRERFFLLHFFWHRWFSDQKREIYFI